MKTKDDFTRKIDNRFNKIYGQIKAIQKHIDEDKNASCKDIVYQIKATRKALKKISDLFIEEKIRKSVDVNKKKFKDLKEALELLTKEY